MSLGASLQIGRSGLVAHQVAIQVTGNNLANAATKGYHRQTALLSPVQSQQIQQGIFVGRGVQVQSILRQVDEALEGRIRESISQQSGSLARKDALAQIEALQNELSDIDLSTRLSDFFNSWSQLAANPQDLSLRSLAVQQGVRVTSYLQELRTGLTDLRAQTDNAIDAAAVTADDLLSQIEDLNIKISTSEAGSKGAAGLRDQRDQLLTQLAEYLDISTVEQANGAVDIFVGSLPIVLNGQSRGLEIRKQTIDGELEIDVVLKADGSVLDSSSGKIGALVEARRQDINQAIEFLDRYANHLIYEVNKVHSQGQGLNGFATVSGSSRVTDTAAALNTAAAGLKFTPGHGSFQIHVTDPATGQRNSSTIRVDLDGINSASDTTLTSLVADLNAVANVTASILPDGRLRLDSGAPNLRLSFSDDTSGVLAALGVNTFFTGSDAQDVAVNDVVRADLSLIAGSTNHSSGGNGNALKLADLRQTPLAALGGLSLVESWNRHVEDYAVRLGQASSSADASTLVRENLEAQQQSVSGVNTDEEAVNLLAFQRAYQASARFLTVVDEMYQTLLTLV